MYVTFQAVLSPIRLRTHYRFCMASHWRGGASQVAGRHLIESQKSTPDFGMTWGTVERYYDNTILVGEH